MDIIEPTARMLPIVARMLAGELCCMAMASGGAPTDVKVPINPENSPAMPRLIFVGDILRPETLRATARRMMLAKIMLRKTNER